MIKLRNKKIVKCGIVGIGGIGQYHLLGLEKTKSAQLVALCDKDKDILDKESKKRSIPGYKDFKDMLKEGDIDAVIISVPTFLHQLLVEMALEEKIHVLQEKPMASNLKTARMLYNKAREEGVLYAIGTQRRFAYGFCQGARLLPKIGTIQMIRGHFIFPWPFKSFGWRSDKTKIQKGALMDAGYHLVDLVNWYKGIPDYVHMENNNITNRTAEYPETAAVMTLKYNDGCFGYIITAFTHGPVDDVLILYGKQGVLELSWQKAIHRSNKGMIIKEYFHEEKMEDVFRKEDEHFATAIIENSELMNSAETNLKNVAILESAYRSLKIKKQKKY